MRLPLVENLLITVFSKREDVVLSRSVADLGFIKLCPGLKSVRELKQSLLIVDDVQVIDVRSHFRAVFLGQHVS